MTTFEWFILILLFFITSLIGVVTGSNSLITVPVMFQFGIDPKVAVATNMFGLTFMSMGASIPFVKKRMIDVQKALPLVVITLVASSIGAFLVAVINPQSIKIIVSIAMVLVSTFMLFKNKSNSPQNTDKFKRKKLITFMLTFLLGIYGGIYSGGYVTLLTAAYVAFAGMSFFESVALTKFINVFSSFIATAIFVWHDLIDYKLGIILAITMFIGAYIGASVATKLNESLLKHVFVATVLILAVKTLIDAV